MKSEKEVMERYDKYVEYLNTFQDKSSGYYSALAKVECLEWVMQNPKLREKRIVNRGTSDKP